MVVTGGKGLPFKGRMVKSKCGAYIGLLGMMVTSLFSSLFCTASWFPKKVSRASVFTVHPFQPLSQLQKFVSFVNYFPRRKMDGRMLCRQRHRKNSLNILHN